MYNTNNYRMTDEGKAYIFEYELAGFTKKDVELTARELKHWTLLSVKAERDSKNRSTTFRMPNKISIEEISSEMKNGLLKVTLPKEEDRSQINIKVN